MIDKKIELEIKALKGYLEFWTKFHSIYDEAVSSEIISSEDEAKFLETRDSIKAKYTELKKLLDTRYAPHGRMTDPVDGVLAISGIRLTSEKSLKKLNDDWRDSYVFLNSIMESLKKRKKHFEGLNPVAMFFRKVFDYIK